MADHGQAFKEISCKYDGCGSFGDAGRSLRVPPLSCNLFPAPFVESTDTDCLQVKLLVGAMGGELSLKLPFTLMHSTHEPETPLPLCSTPPPETSGGGGGGGGNKQPEEAANKEDEDAILQCNSEPP